MSTITGTIKSVTLLRGPDNQSAVRRYTYHITADFTATTAGDDFQVTGVAAAIASTNQHSGKTLQLRQATTGQPGTSAGGTAVYALAVTVDTAAIDGTLGGQTAAAVVAGCSSVGLIAVLDEAAA